MAINPTEAEFYMLHDRRPEYDVLGLTTQELQQYDPDPEATLELKRLRYSRHKELDPSWPNSDPCKRDIFKSIDLRMPPDLVAKSSAFHGNMPSIKPHYHLIRDFCDLYYYVVSAAWRTALETLEPDVHEFFPHELHFTDGAMSDHFVFRERRCLDRFLDPEHSDVVRWLRKSDGVLLWEFPATGAPPKKISAFRRLTVNRHWVRQRPEDVPYAFVSPLLAKKVSPLLPNDTQLIPVALTGQ